MALTLVSRTILDDESIFIADLARMGFAYTTIARQIYGDDCCNRKGEVHPCYIRRIGYVLAQEGVRVTDYRNGANKEGKAILAAIRRGEDILERIRHKVAKRISA